jgi:nuclear pore complex protein Nup85
VEDKDFSLAVSYCASAEDWSGLGRVVDRVLEEYINNGLLPSWMHFFLADLPLGPTPFARYMSDIAPSLQTLRMQPGSPGVFIHRLMFAVRYAEFQRRRMNMDLQDAAQDLVAMLHEDIAPKSWWGILLCDAVDLLKGEPNSWYCFIVMVAEVLVSLSRSGTFVLLCRGY